MWSLQLCQRENYTFLCISSLLYPLFFFVCFTFPLFFLFHFFKRDYISIFGFKLMMFVFGGWLPWCVIYWSVSWETIKKQIWYGEWNPRCTTMSHWLWSSSRKTVIYYIDLEFRRSFIDVNLCQIIIFPFMFFLDHILFV